MSLRRPSTARGPSERHSGTRLQRWRPVETGHAGQDTEVRTRRGIPGSKVRSGEVNLPTSRSSSSAVRPVRSPTRRSARSRRSSAGSRRSPAQTRRSIPRRPRPPRSCCPARGCRRWRSPGSTRRSARRGCRRPAQRPTIRANASRACSTVAAPSSVCRAPSSTTSTTWRVSCWISPIKVAIEDAAD